MKNKEQEKSHEKMDEDLKRKFDEFWKKVPDAGIDEETGIPARWLNTYGKRPPKGEFIMGGGFVSLGKSIEVDGSPLHEGVVTLTKAASYTLAERVRDREVFQQVFPPSEGGHSESSEADRTPLLDEKTTRILQGYRRGVPLGAFKFTVDEIGVRKYQHEGRGETIYVLDRNSPKKINVRGHIFDATEWGNQNRFQDLETGAYFVFTISHKTKETLPALIPGDQIEYVADEEVERVRKEICQLQPPKN